MKVDQVITEDEEALYDRQIRLWGVDAQKKLLAARILMINMSGLAAEIAKNLVLSGISRMTVLDENDVTEEDTRTNFLLPHSTIGKNRAESCINELLRLNPNVKVVADKSRLADKEASFFSESNFDLVCALIDNPDQIQTIDAYCRQGKVMFLNGVVKGMYGYMFVDFNEFQYIAEVPKINEDGDTQVKEENSGEEKLMFQEKSVSFKSYKEFLEGYERPLEGLSFNKMKRLSKAYFINLIFGKFYSELKRSFDIESKEDRVKLLEVKKSLFEKYSIDEKILSDSFLEEKKFEKNFCTVSVNAILGGTMGQEIIRAISKKNQPTENFFLFDAENMNGDIMKI